MSPQATKPNPIPSRLSLYLSSSISLTSTLLTTQLYLLTLAIGIQDAVLFPNHYCFASNQTGNTVLFAVGALHLQSSNPAQAAPQFSLSTIGTSLSFFIIGTFISGQIAAAYDVATTRWWLLLTNLVQTALVLVATGLDYAFPDASTFDSTHSRIVIGLLATASGMQLAMVRGLKVADITTATATAAYVDIFIDPRVFEVRGNKGRNRRVLFLGTLVVGSFLGAVAGRWVGTGFALLGSAVVKMAVTGGFLWGGGEEKGGV